LEIRDYMMALFKPNIPRKPLIELVLWKESGTVRASIHCMSALGYQRKFQPPLNNVRYQEQSRSQVWIYCYRASEKFINQWNYTRPKNHIFLFGGALLRATVIYLRPWGARPALNNNAKFGAARHDDINHQTGGSVAAMFVWGRGATA